MLGSQKRGKIDFRTPRRLTEDLIHHRPDVILRAMPERSMIVIEPCTDYSEYCWTMGPPNSKKLTGKLFRNQQTLFKVEKHGPSQGEPVVRKYIYRPPDPVEQISQELERESEKEGWLQSRYNQHFRRVHT